MMKKLTRRHLLAASVGSTTALIAGCTTSGAIVELHDERCSRGNVITGGRCEFLVENNGISTDVRIIINYKDSQRDVIVGSDETVEYLPNGEVVHVQINTRPPSEADSWSVDFQDP